MKTTEAQRNELRRFADDGVFVDHEDTRDLLDDLDEALALLRRARKRIGFDVGNPLEAELLADIAAALKDKS